MGKKAKFKQIRKLASQMPEINVQMVKGCLVKGIDTTPQDREVMVAAGIEVKPEVNYRKKQLVTEPVNHNRKMKVLYNKYGAIGIKMYVNAVQRYVSAQSKAPLNQLPGEPTKETQSEA